MTINISELKTLVTTLLHPITIFLYFGINRAEFFVSFFVTLFKVILFIFLVLFHSISVFDV